MLALDDFVFPAGEEPNPWPAFLKDDLHTNQMSSRRVEASRGLPSAKQTAIFLLNALPLCACMISPVPAQQQQRHTLQASAPLTVCGTLISEQA